MLNMVQNYTTMSHECLSNYFYHAAGTRTCIPLEEAIEISTYKNSHSHCIFLHSDISGTSEFLIIHFKWHVIIAQSGGLFASTQVHHTYIAHLL